MTPQEKSELMMSRILTDATFRYLKHKEGHEKKVPLNIWGPLLTCLSDDDLEFIRHSHIYLSVMFSPSSHSIIKTELPVNAKIITFDYNHLKNLDQDERLAIILHEYGHAFNPHQKGDDGEIVADDFAIAHGYGAALRSSLERNIRDFPDEFDQPINHRRVARIGI